MRLSHTHCLLCAGLEGGHPEGQAANGLAHVDERTITTHDCQCWCLQHPVIHKGAPLPATGRQAFTTSLDNQQVIVFEVGAAVYLLGELL